MAVLIPATPPPAEAQINALADEIGHAIPASYLDFVRRHDGAKPQDNLLKVSSNEVGVSRFIPVGQAAELATQIDGFPAGVIPFAEDDCGNYFYVAPTTGSVYFWDHEIEGADERIAGSAQAFADMLMSFDASAVKLAPGQVTSAWIDPSFKPEF